MVAISMATVSEIYRLLMDAKPRSATDGTKDRPDWAKLLQRLRSEAGLTQAAVAKKLNVTQSSVTDWERGLTKPRPGFWGPLSQLLAVGEQSDPVNFALDLAADETTRLQANLFYRLYREVRAMYQGAGVDPAPEMIALTAHSLMDRLMLMFRDEGSGRRIELHGDEEVDRVLASMKKAILDGLQP